MHWTWRRTRSLWNVRRAPWRQDTVPKTFSYRWRQLREIVTCITAAGNCYVVAEVRLLLPCPTKHQNINEYWRVKSTTPSIVALVIHANGWSPSYANGMNPSPINQKAQWTPQSVWTLTEMISATEGHHTWSLLSQGKVFPLQAWAGPWESGRLRLRIFSTLGTMMVVRPSPLRTGRLYPPGVSWYSLLEAESTPGHMVPSVAS
jgi:hypothetical protein